MPSATLIVFGGTLLDGSLASNFFAFIKLYLRVPECEVTAIASCDLGSLVETGPLLHGYEKSQSGRIPVWTKYERDHRLHPYRIVPPANMKNTIFQWISSHDINAINVMTLVFIAHGGRAHGEICLGTGNAQVRLFPQELMPHLNQLHAGPRINLTFLSCYSGKWVDEVRLNCTHLNTFVHAVCGSDEVSGPFRSISGVFRCGLFGSAVVAQIPALGSMMNYLDGVDDYMNIVIADPSTDAPPHLATNATMLPTPLAERAVRDVLLSARKVQGAAQLPRANLQVSGSSQQQPTLPFAPSSATHAPSILTYSAASTPRTSGSSTAAKETIAKLISQATSLDYKEVRLDGMSRQFLAGHLSSDEIEAFKQRLNQRREQQNAICILFAALMREMIVDRYEIVGRSFSMMRWAGDPAVVYNMELITKCFPLLGVPVDEFAFEWPAVYLAYAMGLAATKGRPVSSAMLMRVGAGVGIIAAPAVGGDMRFRSVKIPEAEGSVSLHIFDRLLPTTRQELDARLVGVQWISEPLVSLC
jgi:hypothetical protein